MKNIPATGRTTLQLMKTGNLETRGETAKRSRKRAIAVITAVMAKEVMKGSGKKGWKKMRNLIQNICDGQRGREKTQMEICLPLQL